MLRLDANEGQCLLSEEDLRAILSPEIARRYPMRELLEIPLAEKLGIPSSCLLATAGADDAIDRAIRSLAGPGGLVMSTTPGFVEFLEAAQRSSARFEEIAKNPFGPFPIDDICRCVKDFAPKLLILSSPDNPSGVVLSPLDVTQIAKACLEAGTIFVFDATYQEFSIRGATPIQALVNPNVLVTGSFSKSKGLAGFRIGYAAATPESARIISKLSDAGPPYSLSSSAIEAGRRALSLDQGVAQGFIDEVRREVHVLKSLCRKLGFLVSESEANFVLLKIKNPIDLSDRLRERGILVRTWPNKPGYEELVRITVPGEPEEFKELCVSLEAAIKEYNENYRMK
ncbi:MAG: histidinol-phosphate aminotransferase family protein [Treponema sp.]|nr:histidinol-phosphate aminotransferase family protein [Treponema sp.]